MEDLSKLVSDEGQPVNIEQEVNDVIATFHVAIDRLKDDLKNGKLADQTFAITFGVAHKHEDQFLRTAVGGSGSANLSLQLFAEWFAMSCVPSAQKEGRPFSDIATERIKFFAKLTTAFASHLEQNGFENEIKKAH